MDLIDQLKELSLRIKKIKDTIQTEEATKTALVMPFIQGLSVCEPCLPTTARKQRFHWQHEPQG